MRIFSMTLIAAAMLIPATASANGYNSYGYASAQKCQNTANMDVACESGVTVYRAKPVQYGPGELQARISSDAATRKNKVLLSQLAQSKSKLRQQKSEISELEDRIEALQNRRTNYKSGQFINGIGFGPNFISAQRAPGLANGFYSGRRGHGRRGRRHR